MSLKNALRSAQTFLTPRHSSDDIRLNGFRKAPEGELFPQVDPAIDGEDCDHDCETCIVQLPKGWKIDEKEKLYGHVNGWATHMLVATGKTDWVRDVTDEKGSVMEAVGAYHGDPPNGKLMLSASNIPLPEGGKQGPPDERETTVLLLPSFTFVDGVSPKAVGQLIDGIISTSSTSTTSLAKSDKPEMLDMAKVTLEDSSLKKRPCQHKYLILMCSQRTRDARCGQSAPLLKREFERHLRPLGLYRDLQDARPGGVGIYFISHTGGHKFSANVMVYRRGEGTMEASQCIWLARVRPEDCEGIVKYTVLQGKVVKPERQLRGGYDREKGLVSW